MKVYAFDLLPWPYLDRPSYYPDPNALFDPVRATQVYAEHLEQMAKPYGLMPSPNLIAAALTQRTRHIKIGILGNLPALHGHPVRLAEEIAMLAGASQRGVGPRHQGLDHARAVRVARQVLELRPGLDLAAPPAAAASADRAARR